MSRPDASALRDLRPHLDHVFVTVDAAALGAISEDKFFADSVFGRFFVKNAVSTLLGPYRTSNVVGRNTCVELFSQDAPPFPNVRVGVVMSFDHVGESPEARARLDRIGVPYHHELIRRQVAGHDEPQPWYHLVRPDFGEHSGFTLFLSEITPEYFDRLGATRGEGGAQDRHAYLDAALKKPHLPSHNFEDIRRVVLSMSDEGTARLAAILTELGYRAERRAAAVHLYGPDVELEVRPGAARGADRLIELGLGLRQPHPAGAEVHPLGGASQIALSPAGEAAAIWSFGGVS